MSATLLLVVLVLTGAVVFLSLIEVSTSRLSRLSLRVLAERQRDHKVALLEELSRDRSQFLIPLQFTIQVLLVTIAVAVTGLVAGAGVPYPLLVALAWTVATVAVFRQLIPRLLAQRKPEAVLLKLLPLLAGVYRSLLLLWAPLRFLLKSGQRLSDPIHGAPEPDEASEEEIQAYLGVGEEEGIFEQNETELIQSALEFGTTLAREIMTPRAEMVAVEDTATIAGVKDIIVDSKHSRIPVYRDTLDQIVGVVYVRNLLSYLDKDQGKAPLTPLLKKPLFVPETKKVAELLKEMQINSEPLAIVVNEYGGVSGLVSIEDVIEEIVGEIYDEDEFQTVELLYEGKGTYVIRGGLEIDELEDALDLDFGEPEVTTVSGLLVEHLGKVPASGEKLEIGKASFEVIDASRRKINTLRVRLLDWKSEETTLDTAAAAPLDKL